MLDVYSYVSLFSALSEDLRAVSLCHSYSQHKDPHLKYLSSNFSIKGIFVCLVQLKSGGLKWEFLDGTKTTFRAHIGVHDADKYSI